MLVWITNVALVWIITLFQCEIKIKRLYLWTTALNALGPISVHINRDLVFLSFLFFMMFDSGIKDVDRNTTLKFDWWSRFRRENIETFVPLRCLWLFSHCCFTSPQNKQATEGKMNEKNKKMKKVSIFRSRIMSFRTLNYDGIG